MLERKLERKVLSITNPNRNSDQVLELERLLNKGWNVINSVANKYAIMYILEKDITIVDTVWIKEVEYDKN